MKPDEFAERIRGECLQAALHAYENAGMQGLCAEGRWEAAVDALQTLDLAPLWREFAVHSAQSRASPLFETNRTRDERQK